jgi:hypothetical protein
MQFQNSVFRSREPGLGIPEVRLNRGPPARDGREGPTYNLWERLIPDFSLLNPAFLPKAVEDHLRLEGRIVVTTKKLMKTLFFSLMAIFGTVSAYAGTVHAGQTTVHRGYTVHTGGHYNHNNYHGNYGGYHGGHGYYANEGHNGRYWHGGYYGGRYYGAGYYPYNSPFFIGLPVPFPVPVPE